MGSIPRLGRVPGEEKGTPLQYSCPENSMDRGAWKASVHRVAKNQTWLSKVTVVWPWNSSKDLLQSGSFLLILSSLNSKSHLSPLSFRPTSDYDFFKFSSVQISLSVAPDFLWPHGLQHVSPPCPSPTPGIYSSSCPLSCDFIQPSHPLLPPSPPTVNLSQHQGLFQWVSSSHQVVKILEFQL